MEDFLAKRIRNKLLCYYLYYIIRIIALFYEKNNYFWTIQIFVVLLQKLSLDSYPIWLRSLAE